MKYSFPDHRIHTIRIANQSQMFIWGTLPSHIDAETLLQKAIANNIAFAPARHSFPEKHSTTRCVYRS